MLTLLAQVPSFGEDVKRKNSAAELEKAWVRAPLTVAIGGPVSARTELVNYLCDRKVLDPAGRPNECAALRIRRGTQTRFKAIRDDDTTEEHVLPPEQADDGALRDRAQGAKAAVEERKLALARIERALPRGARARPRGIWIFLWPIWWLLTRRHRRILGDRMLAERAYDQACDGQAVAERELSTSADRIRVERTRFFESLRALSSGLTLGGRVREVELVLGEGPLPPGVDLIEMVRANTNESVDAVLILERDVFHAPQTEGGEPRRIGTIAETIPTLLALLGRTRARTLARAAHEELAPAIAALDDDINDTEEGFRVRIARLEAMQILDAEEFARTELGKLKPQIDRAVREIIERGAQHLGGELDRLRGEWTQALSALPDNDQLKSAVARIESSTPLDAKRIAEEVRTVAFDSAAAHIAELLPDLLASLRAHGLEEEPPASPTLLPPLEILPVFAGGGAVKKRPLTGTLAGLLKSFESRRTEALTKADQRITALREAATTELNASERKLRELFEQALYLQLRHAIARQVAWLDRTLAAEREAVVAEGVALAPLARQRDTLKADLAKLAEGLAAHEITSGA